MGQTMCGGAREAPKTLDISIFDKSPRFCAVRKGSPYYRRRIRQAERRVENAKVVYENYKESKLQRQRNNDFMCKNKNRIRSNSN